MSENQGVPVQITRRSPASRLRYLADQVEMEWDPSRQLGVSFELRDLALELEVPCRCTGS